MNRILKCIRKNPTLAGPTHLGQRRHSPWEETPRARGANQGDSAQHPGQVGKPPRSRGKPSQPDKTIIHYTETISTGDFATPHIHRRHRRNRTYPAPGSSNPDRKAWKRLCPSTHRSAIRGLNPRSQAHFPRQPRDFTSATKNGLRDQKGGSDPALFLLPTTCKRPTDKASSMATSDIYTRRFRYSTHSTNTLTIGNKVFRSWPGQETRLAYRRRSPWSPNVIQPAFRRSHVVRMDSLSARSSEIS